MRGILKIGNYSIPIRKKIVYSIPIRKKNSRNYYEIDATGIYWQSIGPWEFFDLVYFPKSVCFLIGKDSNHITRMVRTVQSPKMPTTGGQYGLCQLVFKGGCL